MRSGVIVAGGYSTRFGEQDKALADLGGVAMARHVADRIEPVIDDLVVNCREEQRDDLSDAMRGFEVPVSFAVDERPGLGPVGGIATGLGAVTEDTGHAVVVACDMPFVEADLVGHLFTIAEGDDIDAVLPRSSDGWYQVLHAVYEPTAMRHACERALDAGERKVLAPLSYLDVYTVEGEELAAHGSERSFENVNSRDELEAARVHLDLD